MQVHVGLIHFLKSGVTKFKVINKFFTHWIPHWISHYWVYIENLNSYLPKHALLLCLSLKICIEVIVFINKIKKYFVNDRYKKKNCLDKRQCHDTVMVSDDKTIVLWRLLWYRKISIYMFHGPEPEHLRCVSVFFRTNLRKSSY